MPTPDLPAELWLQILSYLPRTTVRKVIGINRFLFEYALDDIHRTVYFTPKDEHMVQTLRQLLDHKNLAKRVHCLHIQPLFSTPAKCYKQSAFIRQLALAIGHLRSRATALFNLCPAQDLKVSSKNPSFDLLGMAKETVKRCQNAREIKIMFDDRKVTPSFISFLDSLWLADSIGPNVSKLSVDATFIQFLLVLKPLLKNSSLLTNLRVFDLKLCLENCEVRVPAPWYQAIEALLSFFRAFKDTLTCISISSQTFCDHGLLFNDFPHIRQLKEFRFFGCVCGATMVDSPGGNFTKFLSKHASSLEVLTISSGSSESFMPKCQSLEIYNLWLEQNFITPPVLPKLHTLQIQFL